MLTQNELLAYRQQFRSGPNFDEDLTEVAGIQVSTDEIGFLAQLNTGFPRARRAIVANRTLFYRLARVHEVNLGGQLKLTQVFEDLPSTRRWLGLDDLPGSPRSAR